jgi:hypothetical protein
VNEEPRPLTPKELSFRIGDVFDPDDDLSLWFCTIALAFNDIVFTHTRADEAIEDWERFYFSRVGIGHYNEILLLYGAPQKYSGDSGVHRQRRPLIAAGLRRDTREV